MPFENLVVHWDSNSQNERALGSVGVHSFTLSYTLKNMKCDSRASFLAHTFASSCFSRKPKVKVTTHSMKDATNPTTKFILNKYHLKVILVLVLFYGSI
jgi:hypothetical protein